MSIRTLNLSLLSDEMLESFYDSAINEYERVREETGSRAGASAEGAVVQALSNERDARRERSACCLGAATTGRHSALCGS